MVYNHLKDKVKSFLQPFAESGQAVGAEDIKTYFEKLRGDEQGIKNAGSGATNGRTSKGEEGDGGDNRREQSGKSLYHNCAISCCPWRSLLLMKGYGRLLIQGRKIL